MKKKESSVPLRKTVAQQLRVLREARGLSTADVAARAGVQQRTIYRIESGTHNFRIESLGGYVAACGSTLAEFFCGTALPNARHIDQEYIDQFLRILNDRRYRKTAIDFVEVLDRAIREGSE